VHPATLASYRQGFRPSGAKSDPSDAGLILELLLQHRNKLRRLNPDTLETRTLQFLSNSGASSWTKKPATPTGSPPI
jgi:hypothetical protein